MHASSPAGSVFALDLTGLQGTGVTVWIAWHGKRIASIGALKITADGTAEVKSKRTHPDFLRMGAGAAVLETIIAAAKRHGVQRLSLETVQGHAWPNVLCNWSTAFRRFTLMNPEGLSSSIGR